MGFFKIRFEAERRLIFRDGVRDTGGYFCKNAPRFKCDLQSG